MKSNPDETLSLADPFAPPVFSVFTLGLGLGEASDAVEAWTGEATFFGFGFACFHSEQDTPQLASNSWNKGSLLIVVPHQEIS